MEATTRSPVQQLRAYVDYLRDLGIYDLYRREDPKLLLSEALRESLMVEMAAQTVSLQASAQIQPAQTTPAARPAPAAGPFFQTKPPTLSPELSAPMPKPVSFDALAPIAD